jgi:hypothetical protein
MPAFPAVRAVQREVGAGSITSRAVGARQQDLRVADGLVPFLIKEAGAKHSWRLGILESNRIRLMNLRPRQRNRVSARLACSDERPEVNLLVLAEKTTTNDIVQPIRVGQQGREGDGLSLRDLADVGAEAEKYRPSIRSSCSARGVVCPWSPM